jgi:hypothetical protein
MTEVTHDYTLTSPSSIVDVFRLPPSRAPDVDVGAVIV